MPLSQGCVTPFDRIIDIGQNPISVLYINNMRIFLAAGGNHSSNGNKCQRFELCMCSIKFTITIIISGVVLMYIQS